MVIINKDRKLHIQTNIKGTTTPIRFVLDNLNDVEKGKIIIIIETGGFILNGNMIVDPNLDVDIKTGDTIILNFDNIIFEIM